MSTWPPAARPDKKSIDVRIQGVQGDLLAVWQRQAVRACEDSGLFSEVSAGSERPSDYRADVRVEHEVSGSWLNAGMRFLSGVTLFLVPCTATDDFDVQVTFSDANGRTLATHQESAGATLWVQTFMVFAAPFKTAEKVLDEVYYDTMRSALVRAGSEGTL